MEKAVTKEREERLINQKVELLSCSLAEERRSRGRRFIGASWRCFRKVIAALRFFTGTHILHRYIQRKPFDMESAIKRLEKQVDEVKVDIADLNERFGEFMMEIKEALLAQREERGKSHLVRSLIKDKLSILERLEQFKLAGSVVNPVRFDSLDEMIRSLPKSVSKPNESGGTSRKKTGIKRMTEGEFQFRIKMGLCFLCNDGYSENHDCKNKHLQLLVVDDDEDESDEEGEQKTVIGEDQNAQSMNSTKENHSATFKFMGNIGSTEVVVKIGSTAHNFISEELVAELQIPVEPTKRFRVNFGCGVKHEGRGVCKNVVVEAQGAEIVGRFFPTKLGTADVMLGLEWLKSLGRVYHERSPPSLSFVWHGRALTLQSDPSLTKGMELGIMTLEWVDDEED